MKKFLSVFCVLMLTLAAVVSVTGCKVKQEKATTGESTGFGTTTPSSTTTTTPSGTTTTTTTPGNNIK